MKRWHKITLIMVGGVATARLALHIHFPNHSESVRCVAMLPNGELVQARGPECENPEFKSVVFLTLDEDGNLKVDGDAVFGP